MTSRLPKNLADDRSTFPSTVTTRATPMVEKIKQRIIFQVTFRRKSIASANRVNMGRAATIIEALDAVVYRSPVFSREKYITIPKKLARTIYPMSLRTYFEWTVRR